MMAKLHRPHLTGVSCVLPTEDEATSGRRHHGLCTRKPVPSVSARLQDRVNCRELGD